MKLIELTASYIMCREQSPLQAHNDVNDMFRRHTICLEAVLVGSLTVYSNPRNRRSRFLFQEICCFQHLKRRYSTYCLKTKWWSSLPVRSDFPVGRLTDGWELNIDWRARVGTVPELHTDSHQLSSTPFSFKFKKMRELRVQVSSERKRIADLRVRRIN